METVSCSEYMRSLLGIYCIRYLVGWAAGVAVRLSTAFRKQLQVFCLDLFPCLDMTERRRFQITVFLPLDYLLLEWGLSSSCGARQPQKADSLREEKL